MNDITKDAKRILLTLYREYLNRRDDGYDRQSAAYFGDSDSLQETYFDDESSEDIADFCWELQRNGYIACFPGEDLANDVTLLPETIVAMEQRFPNGVKSLLDAISKLSRLI